MLLLVNKGVVKLPLYSTFQSGVLYLLGKVFLQWSVKVLYCSLYNGFLYDSMKSHMFTCTCTSKMLPAVYQNARIKLTH